VGVLVALIAAVGLLAGCGGSSKKSTSSSTSTAAPTSSSTSAQTQATTTSSTSTATAPAAAAASWTQPNGNLAGTRDVVSSINSSNVSKLGVAWKVPITGKVGIGFGSFAATPVIVGGVAYFQDLDSSVWAVKMSTGKLLWHTQMNSPNVGPDGVNVVGGKVYGATNSKAFALSAATGEQLWSKKLIRNKGEGIDMAPAINNGTVYVSTVPGNGVGGFYTGNGVAVLWAMNAATGKMKWKWNEVPTSLWGNKKVNSGGGQWEPPTFDAQGHLYLEVANPAPFVGDKSYAGKKVYANGSSHPGPNLYTDSVVELNPANGKMVWHYQLTPHDIHDWDLNNQALISTVNGKETIISAGKAGIAIANDAQTGKLLWKTKIGAHNGHDNDGILTIHSVTGHGKVKEPPYTTLPGTLGGVESPYASDGTTAYFAVNNTPVPSKSQAADGTTDYAGGTGVLVAIDQSTGKIKWQHKLSSAPYGAATVSNDLVWTTTFNGILWALNKNTGAVVWHEKLPAGTNAPVAIDGDAVVTGAGFPQGKGQAPMFIAYRIGATKGSSSSKGASTKPASGSKSSATAVSLKAGMKVFSSTCASCHTLAAAGSTGTVGPNLDQLKPSDAVVVKQVTNGGGGMPAFGSSLSKAQIQSVSKYVSTVAGTKKSKPGQGGGGGP
jgi:outer membrane protein assembly factor BamB